METAPQTSSFPPPSNNGTNGSANHEESELEQQVQPNQTIYINNLNERIKKEELRKSLYAMFTQFGIVLDVVALKTLAMRGQAFVVFKDITSATNAMRAMQMFPFFDKPMRIQYAKKPADIIAKLNGTYIPLDKEAIKKRKAEQTEAALKRQKAGGSKKPERKRDENKEPGTQSHLNPKQQPPNKILFVENLPENYTDTALTVLFQQNDGFKEVRMIQGKPGIAFVEFDGEAEAGAAMGIYQHYKLAPTNLMVISYAKK